MTILFWRRALERALKSAAQAALLVVGAGRLNVLDADWASIGGFGAGGFVLSVLMSVGSAPWGEPDSPSLVHQEPGNG